MGQYYKTIIKKRNGRYKVYNRDVIGKDGKKEYTLAKLMEHSWFYNEFVNAVCFDIYNSDKPIKVAWVGDYAKDFLECNCYLFFNGLSQSDIEKLTDLCWDRDGDAVEITDFMLFDKYILNHDKKTYLNCSAFYKNNIMQETEDGGWCLHPLPLLTCIGNGMGCGDYNYPTEDSTPELVGRWAWNRISIEDNAPDDKEYTEINPIFKEKGWD